MVGENTDNLQKDTSLRGSVSDGNNQPSDAAIVTPKKDNSAKEEKEDKEEKPKKHYAPFWNIIAWVAVILTLTAWVVLFYNDNAAMVISIPAVICSALGIHSRFRRTSITMLVASGVLLLVFILFWVAIKVMLG